MSFPTSSTRPSPADGVPAGKARLAALDRVLETLLAAQAELDALQQPLAAARLDAAIDAVRLAKISFD